MLPIRWNQPPCINIDVRIASQFVPGPTTQAVFGPTGNRVPTGSVPNRSPGSKPNAQIDRDSVGSVPRPCTNTQQATLTAIRATVA